MYSARVLAFSRAVAEIASLVRFLGMRLRSPSRRFPHQQAPWPGIQPPQLPLDPLSIHLHLTALEYGHCTLLHVRQPIVEVRLRGPLGEREQDLMIAMLGGVAIYPILREPLIHYREKGGR